MFQLFSLILAVLDITHFATALSWTAFSLSQRSPGPRSVCNSTLQDRAPLPQLSPGQRSVCNSALQDSAQLRGFILTVCIYEDNAEESARYTKSVWRHLGSIGQVYNEHLAFAAGWRRAA